MRAIVTDDVGFIGASVDCLRYISTGKIFGPLGYHSCRAEDAHYSPFTQYIYNRAAGADPQRRLSFIATRGSGGRAAG